jgi:hypothetical protein
MSFSFGVELLETQLSKHHAADLRSEAAKIRHLLPTLGANRLC